MQVLRLIDDDVPIGRLHGSVVEHAGGLVGELCERVPAEYAQPGLDLLDERPYVTALRKDAVRVGTMHGMKGLEFQAVAVVGIADDTVPAPSALTDAAEDPIAHAQDLQRERCLLLWR